MCWRLCAPQVLPPRPGKGEYEHLQTCPPLLPSATQGAIDSRVRKLLIFKGDVHMLLGEFSHFIITSGVQQMDLRAITSCFVFAMSQKVNTEPPNSNETLASLISQNRVQTFMNYSLKVIQGVWGDGSVAERVHRPVRGAKSGFQHPCWVLRTTCNSSSKVSIISGLHRPLHLHAHMHTKIHVIKIFRELLFISA